MDDPAHLSEQWFDTQPPELTQATIIPDLKAADYVDGSEFDVFEFTGIVLTQTCDITQKMPDHLLVAQVNAFSEVFAQSRRWGDSNQIKLLVEGNVMNHYLLPPCPAIGRDWSTVSFLDVFHVPRQMCEDRLSNSIALRTPYLEHFAQAISRFMMRVALPEPLPRELFRTYVKGLPARPA